MENKKLEKKLWKDLDKFGDIQCIKVDKYLTILITGSGLSNWRKVIDIQQLSISEDYQIIDILKNDDHFFFMVLKPKDGK